MSNFNHERLMVVYVANRLSRVCIEVRQSQKEKRTIFLTEFCQTV
jgi:hypothetical protein